MLIDHYQMPVGFLETILMEKFEEMLGLRFELFFFICGFACLVSSCGFVLLF